MIRPLAPADAELFQAFVRGLSPASRRLRFQTGLNELYPALLARLTQVDQRDHVALAAVICEHGRQAMIGEARYAPSGEADGSIEFAIAVGDAWRHIGLGSMLLASLLQRARGAGIERIHGDVLWENAGMLQLAKRFGFAIRRHPDDASLARVARDLSVPARPSALLDRPITRDLEFVAGFADRDRHQQVVAAVERDARAGALVEGAFAQADQHLVS